MIVLCDRHFFFLLIVVVWLVSQQQQQQQQLSNGILNDNAIAGNVFVIAAIILERNLQNVANYLVASLAVADLFVACLVMPLGAVYEALNA
ncbi:hypothetical protein DOY81_011822 [Sarcophaga bullata]|nr:hypothetical protein DOY81_011822 [Sarcophaga bullata]